MFSSSHNHFNTNRILLILSIGLILISLETIVIQKTYTPPRKQQTLVLNNKIKIDTSDWLTYRNERYLYSIKFPSTIIVQTDGNEYSFLTKEILADMPSKSKNANLVDFMKYGCLDVDKSKCYVNSGLNFSIQADDGDGMKEFINELQEGKVIPYFTYGDMRPWVQEPFISPRSMGILLILYRRTK